MSDHAHGYTGLAPLPLYSYSRKQSRRRRQTNAPDQAAGAGTTAASASPSTATAASSSDSTGASTGARDSLGLSKAPSGDDGSSARAAATSSSTASSKPSSARPSSARTPDAASVAPSNRSGAPSSSSSSSSKSRAGPGRKTSSAASVASSSASTPEVATGLIPIDAFGFSQPAPKKHKPARPAASPSPKVHASARDSKNAGMYPDADSSHRQSGSSKQVAPGASSFSRTESVSSTSVTTALSTRTVTSTDPSASGDTPAGGGGPGAAAAKPFVQRNGRTYLSDPSLSYPLPVDLTELHRQSLRTLLLMQVHGAPVACPALTAKPPLCVLEVGCGPGFWSMMCHRYFKSRGHGGASFTGMDIAPIAPGGASGGGPSDSAGPDRDMRWTFVQHDLRSTPWPFADGEFDMVFCKDMSLAVSPANQVSFIEESVRVLRSGGILEIWETDHTIRLLRPHVPNASAMGSQAGEHEAASSLGAYMININTPLSAPLNTFLVEYNSWLTRALDARDLIANPCTTMNHHLLQESEMLSNVGSHRVAIPLSEVRWEREGVGGVVTKDGKSYVEMKGEKLRPPHQTVEKKTLTAGQAALRRTALLTLVEEIQALEPILREVSGKSQDEWDVWMGKMTTDLMSEGGTSWGECLEAGAWWARKK